MRLPNSIKVFVILFYWITMHCGSVKAQYSRYEFGIQGGVSNYWGDLSPSVVLKETHPTGGIFARINLSPSFAWKTELNVLKVSGSDKNFDFNRGRNLSFYSQINEVASVLEFNFFKYGPFVLNKPYTAYFYSGIAAFSFNPQTNLNGKTFDLIDYRTEDVSYSRIGVAIPFGMGFKWMVNKNLALEWQLGFRRTYTDYLDDVSGVYPDIESRFSDGGLITATLTDRSIEWNGSPINKKGYKRGDSNYRDWYMTSTFSLTFRLNSKVKCARFY
ncbi:MAG: DUF6089 family protein [Bacteroidia bacterium]|nr:DUF6089 family protein [Bacteroidia bacterium]